MNLKEEIKTLSGNKRKLLLLRVADLDTKTALKIIGIARSTYNSWFQNGEFLSLYRRVPSFIIEYKQEAIQLLRRDNQLEAVLLESKILKEMKDELESKEYRLLKSHLAREVYSRLLSDLDKPPEVQVLSWEQRVLQILGKPPEQIVEGEYTSVEPEADSVPQAEFIESYPVKESKQAPPAVEEKIQS